MLTKLSDLFQHDGGGRRSGRRLGTIFLAPFKSSPPTQRHYRHQPATKALLSPITTTYGQNIYEQVQGNPDVFGNISHIDRHEVVITRVERQPVKPEIPWETFGPKVRLYSYIMCHFILCVEKYRGSKCLDMFADRFSVSLF